jgi:hypothetical protein
MALGVLVVLTELQAFRALQGFKVLPGSMVRLGFREKREFPALA